MKNKFCVGQQVIASFHDRKLHTIVKVLSSGQIELDNGLIVYPDRVQVQREYLDKTNYLYHHSKWGNGLDWANQGLRTYLMTLADIEECSSDRIKEEFLKPMLAKAAAEIETGYAIMRTAKYNMSQWYDQDTDQTITIDHHFPFLNPEGVTFY